MKIDKLTGRRITSEGQEYIYCSGTDYLGMAYNGQLKRSILNGYDQYGLNYGSSRKHELFDDIYAHAESQIADWVGLDAAVTVSSGTLAGQLVRNVVRAMSYAIIEAPRLHPALKDIYKDSIEQKIDNQKHDLISEINRHPSEKIAVLAVDIDPLSIEYVNLDFLKGIKNKNIILILDDTHGMGVIGYNGGGFLTEHPELQNYEVILISSLAKGVAIPGGVISGPSRFIDKIMNTGHFAGSSPISPAYLHGFIESFEEYQSQRDNLRININLLEEKLDKNIAYKSLENFPIFLLENENIGKVLKENGVWISSTRYPYAHSPLLNRLILNGNHTEDDINQIAERVNLSYNSIS